MRRRTAARYSNRSALRPSWTDAHTYAELYCSTMSRVVPRVRDEEAAGSNPATPTQVKGRLSTSNRPLLILYSSKVQQPSRIELLAETLECSECLLVRDLGVDIHSHLDL